MINNDIDGDIDEVDAMEGVVLGKVLRLLDREFSAL